MTVLAQRLLNQALELPQGERVEVARKLLMSIAPSVAETKAKPAAEMTFSEKWRGKFEPAERPDPLYEALARKHL